MSNSNCTFSFKFETQEKSSKLIQNLNCNKATQKYDIPIKILKENSEIFSYILYHNFNNSLFSKIFPNSLKKADITPVFKNDENSLKNNCRPVRILSTVSNIYERCIYDQINDYFHPLFSKLQGGFRKGFNAQHCLLLLARLHAYGFSLESLTFTQSYLSNRIQRVKINSSFSDYSNVESGVPQGSTSAPLFFNISICDLFFDDIDIDLANYADDMTP